MEKERCRFCNNFVDEPNHHLLTRDEARELAYRLLDVYEVISKSKNRKATPESLTHSIHKLCGKGVLCDNCHKKYHGWNV